MLTAVTVKALKPKTQKFDHMDPDNPGFGVRVMPSGAKSYIYRFRIGGRGGKLRRMSLGTSTTTSLKEARAAYLDARKQHESGIDPLQAKHDARREAEQEKTVAGLVQLYLDQYAVHKRTFREERRIFEYDVLPRWGRLKAKEIKKRDVVQLLDAIVERGAPTQANRTFARVRKLFNWAMEKDLLETTPCAGIKSPSKERTRDRVLNDDEIRQFWNLQGLSPRMKAALRLQLLLGQRIGEVVGMRWDELDTTARLWTLPAERAKNAMVHTIPLNTPALEILEEQRLLRDGDESHVFPARTGKAEHVRVDSIGTALTRAIHAADLTHFTAHDLRRTAATRISGAGTSREVLRQILNHVDRSVTARYDRYRYDREKRHALDTWAQVLNQIITGKQESNVIQLQR